MNFFNEAEDCQDHKVEKPSEKTFPVKAHARKKKRTIDELAKLLPVEEVIIDLPESQRTCDKCEKDTGFVHIVTTKAPPPLMKHSLASPSIVADVMTKKYVDGVPLARHEKI